MTSVGSVGGSIESPCLLGVDASSSAHRRAPITDGSPTPFSFPTYIKGLPSDLRGVFVNDSMSHEFGDTA